MKYLLFSLTLLVFTSCDKILYENGVPPRGYDTKDFALSSFDRVELNNAFFVTIIKSSESKVSAKGSGDDIDDLEVTVTNGKLDIRYDKRIRIKQLKRYKMELVVYTPNITEIDAKSASDTEISGFGTISAFTANVSGASVLRLKNAVKSLTADVSGASRIILPMSVENLDAELSGTSNLDGFEANSSEVFLELSGASKAEVSASKTLNVKASGASKVFYKGEPKITEDLSGGSKVSKE
ncbi:DUF2807 domain-containing protein [Lacihabitans sp. CCS-44]|uniref:head GIN domain-containing protein n=1 Tax=Lacihabitans sp. CCS-44 TaxID=2487331 RepID=UPI0020CB987D|nr:head GIN domain-containing protein [Lacihabitans sp. CCS-44]MCP9756318.1 DUF2807 domain-containing protein [Lacihabitans sp. CCS-44]